MSGEAGGEMSWKGRGESRVECMRSEGRAEVMGVGSGTKFSVEKLNEKMIMTPTSKTYSSSCR